MSTPALLKLPDEIIGSLRLIQSLSQAPSDENIRAIGECAFAILFTVKTPEGPLKELINRCSTQMRSNVLDLEIYRLATQILLTYPEANSAKTSPSSFAPTSLGPHRPGGSGDPRTPPRPPRRPTYVDSPLDRGGSISPEPRR